MEYFSITSDSKLTHRGKKGVITYIHKNGIWKSTKTPNETQAKMLQRKWDNDLFHSDNGLVNRDKTWAEFKQEYLDLYHSNRYHTRLKLNESIKNFERIVHPHKLVGITMVECERWMVQRMREVSPQSTKTEFGFLRPMFRKAHQRGYMERDSFADIRRPKASSPEVVPLSVDQALGSLFMLEKHEPQWALLGHFAYETGMRLEEIAHQRIEDIDFAAAILHVKAHPKGTCSCFQCKKEARRGWYAGWDGKAGVPRKIPLSSYLLVKLLALFQDQKTGCVFQIMPQTIGKVLSRANKRAGNHGVTHIFRHTLATDMERAGVRRAAMRAILGHGRSSTTDTYVHVDMTELHQEFQKVLDWREAERTRVKTTSVGGFQIIEAQGA